MPIKKKKKKLGNTPNQVSIWILELLSPSTVFHVEFTKKKKNCSFFPELSDQFL